MKMDKRFILKFIQNNNNNKKSNQINQIKKKMTIFIDFKLNLNDSSDSDDSNSE